MDHGIRETKGGEVIGQGAGLRVGDRVRVAAGVCSNRSGVVQELDGRGSAKVLFGLLAMWIPLSDLMAVRQSSRPQLVVSHKRPIGIR